MIRQTATIPGQEQLSVANLAASGATSRKRAIRLMWFLVALMLTVSFAFPMYFMVSSSFKSDPEVLANPIHWWPQDYQGLNQYARALDAGREMLVFWQFVLSLLGPPSASFETFTFPFSWTNFLWPLVVIKSEAYPPIPIGLTAFAQPHTPEPQWAMIMAISTLATLPI